VLANLNNPITKPQLTELQAAVRAIVIDCPCYFGNSGALVLEIDESESKKVTFRGIGVVSQLIPFVEELWSKQFKLKAALRYENSGYSLVEPMDRVEELL
jgi:hypothetical protein